MFSGVHTDSCSSCTGVLFPKAELSVGKPCGDDITAVGTSCVGINKPCDGIDDNSEYFNRDLWSSDGFMCGRRNPVGMSVMSPLFATFSSTLTLETNTGLESERGHCQFYS